MRTYDSEIEARRLHFVLALHKLNQADTATRTAYEADPSDEQQLRAMEEQTAQEAHLQDMIELLHWVQGRRDTRELPAETMLSGAGLLGVAAGELACIVTVHEGGVSLHQRVYFPNYDRYSVSRDGWLVGIGTHPPGTQARSKTFRDRLLPVPFTKVALVNQWPGGLTLQLLSAPGA